MSPVCTPIASKFSIEQTITALSLSSRMTSISNSFQPMMLSSIRISPTGESASPPLTIARSSSTLYAMPPPAPPIVNDGRQTTGKPSSSASASASSDRVRIAALGHVEPDALHRLPEELAVLALLDDIELRADELDAVTLKIPCSAQCDRAVEPRLSAERRQQRIGLLALDDLLDELGRDGLDVRARRKLRDRS